MCEPQWFHVEIASRTNKFNFSKLDISLRLRILNTYQLEMDIIGEYRHDLGGKRNELTAARHDLGGKRNKLAATNKSGENEVEFLLLFYLGIEIPHAGHWTT